MQRDAATARARAHRSAGDGARETQASSKLKSAGPSSSSAEACPTPAEYVMLSSRGGRPHDDDATAPAPSSSSPRRHTDMDDAGAGASGRVLEWVTGLPAAAELTPVSHQLIPPALAAAFGIKLTSVFAASSSSLFDSALVHGSPASHLSSRCDEDGDEEGEGETEDAALGGGACRRGRAGKKARMVWTPELHRRFVEAVGRFGHKRAVPKAIVRAMNVDGLTRENVASHLQKYRLYLKRTSTTATPPPLPSLPPAYGSPFSTQLPPNISNRSGYCAFLPRDNEKLERD